MFSAYITDDGVEHLKRLFNLTFVTLKGTAVTDKGIEDLQKALPVCKIYH